MEFDGKVILITGASSGIGSSVAKHFAKLSVKLALVARNKENLNITAKYCKLIKGIEPLEIVGDVSKNEDIERIIDATIKRFGKLDVLINNAASSAIGGIQTTTMNAYDKDMATNLRGVFYLTKLAVPHLIETKGNIINISSVYGIKASTGSLSYSLTKAALDQFTKCLALELAPDGVRVNSVNPGVVRTKMMMHIGLSEEQMQCYMKDLEIKTPLKRVVESEEIAHLIEFLAGEKARNITGVLSVIDGGLVLS